MEQPSYFEKKTEIVRPSRNTLKRWDAFARNAHAFHRWAHHPLCAAYATETWRVGGKTRVCLGCSLAAIGAVSGLAIGMLLPWLIALVSGGGLLLTFVSLELTPRSRGVGARRRYPKALTRCAPAMALAFVCSTMAQHPSVMTRWLTAGGVSVALVGLFAYRRRGPNRAPCVDCPERHDQPTCSGFIAIYRRERALQRHLTK